MHHSAPLSMPINHCIDRHMNGCNFLQEMGRARPRSHVSLHTARAFAAQHQVHAARSIGYVKTNNLLQCRKPNHVYGARPRRRVRQHGEKPLITDAVIFQQERIRLVRLEYFAPCLQVTEVAPDLRWRHARPGDNFVDVFCVLERCPVHRINESRRHAQSSELRFNALPAVNPPTQTDHLHQRITLRFL